MRDYQLVRVGDAWHLTQQQAVPPDKRGDTQFWTMCEKWASLRDGYKRGEPTCGVCKVHVLAHDARIERVEPARDPAIAAVFHESYGRSGRRRRAS